MANLLALEKSEKPCAFLSVRDFDERFLVKVTDRGTIKKTALSAYSRPKRGGIIAINLDAGERVMGARITRGNDNLVVATRKGFAIRFPETGARPMGRATHGVKALTLRKDDSVVDFAIEEPDATLFTVCENGFGKRTTFDAYRLQKRGGSGVINIKATERNGEVVGLLTVKDEDEVMLVSSGGMIVRTPISQVRAIGRATQGVRIITLKKNQRLVSMAKVVIRENGDKDEDVPSSETSPEDDDATTDVDETGQDGDGDESPDDAQEEKEDDA